MENQATRTVYRTRWAGPEASPEYASTQPPWHPGFCWWGKNHEVGCPRRGWRPLGSGEGVAILLGLGTAGLELRTVLWEGSTRGGRGRRRRRALQERAREANHSTHTRPCRFRVHRGSRSDCADPPHPFVSRMPERSLPRHSGSVHRLSAKAQDPGSRVFARRDRPAPPSRSGVPGQQAGGRSGR